MPPSPSPSPELRALLEARDHDPFRWLGRHPEAGGTVLVRAFLPHTATVTLVEGGLPLQRVGATDLFEWRGPAAAVPPRYRLRSVAGDGTCTEAFDPYCFLPQLDEGALAAFNGGHHNAAHHLLGSRAWRADGVDGVLFAVWAPNADRVSVVGDFNRWDGRCHPMRVRGGTGVWELFIPGLGDVLYKYEIRNRESGALRLKSDPFGREHELRPATASRFRRSVPWRWNDAGWLARRRTADWLHAPLAIYEVHLGSWRRRPDGQPLSYRQAAAELVPYVKEQGFTHVEFLPLTEYPLDESWGYQAVGYFAPTSRYGSPDDFRYLVDACHQAGLGVIIDWVPGHFPRDAHGLADFDGSPLFEYGDPLKGHQPDWGTLVFNFDRNEVRSFLLSSARCWLEDFHVDGLRVDAVASMLYLDYSRRPGEWTPNVHGGNENLEAVQFLRELNTMTHRDFPGTVTIAEESTAWPGVSRPVETGGLGFSMKWNMGWMHDTLKYLAKDPVHRRHHHDLLTFGPLYAFSENFVLPLSHDEVVHGKGSLLGKMPGDDWQRFANLRLAFLFQWTYPGRKLLFMGGELAQPSEWNHRDSLPWHLAADHRHGGVQRLVRDLNGLHRALPALHRLDFAGQGFQWLCWDDADHSTLAFLRRAGADVAAVALNFTPVPRAGYRLGVPRAGDWREALNSDSRFYGGSDLGNGGVLRAEPVPCMHQPWSVVVTLPPLGGLVLTPSA
ncbi:MAG: 1,4-alpha-glucan branching protein GlgB [Gammaproteobacteria bacterium]|nr:1,4-alpha-glucan branching protein GlgB [Gammaproteobacteria bacterium]